MTTEVVTKSPPKPLAVVTIRTESGNYTTPCEMVGDALAITPIVGMDEEGNMILAGTFTVTHVPSGREMVEGDGCVACCRSAAKALVATGIDWAALDEANSAELVATWSPEQKLAVAEARAVEFGCDAEDCGSDSDDSYQNGVEINV